MKAMDIRLSYIHCQVHVLVMLINIVISENKLVEDCSDRDQWTLSLTCDSSTVILVNKVEIGVAGDKEAPCGNIECSREDPWLLADIRKRCNGVPECLVQKQSVPTGDIGNCSSEKKDTSTDLYRVYFSCENANQAATAIYLYADCRTNISCDTGFIKIKSAMWMKKDDSYTCSEPLSNYPQACEKYVEDFDFGRIVHQCEGKGRCTVPVIDMVIKLSEGCISTDAVMKLYYTCPTDADSTNYTNGRRKPGNASPASGDSENPISFSLVILIGVSTAGGICFLLFILFCVLYARKARSNKAPRKGSSTSSVHSNGGFDDITDRYAEIPSDQKINKRIDLAARGKSNPPYSDVKKGKHRNGDKNSNNCDTEIIDNIVYS